MSNIGILGPVAAVLIIVIAAGIIWLSARGRANKRAAQRREEERQATDRRIAAEALAQQQGEFMALTTRAHHGDPFAIEALQSEPWAAFIEQDDERQRLAASAIDYGGRVIAGCEAKDLLTRIDMLSADTSISDRIWLLEELIGHILDVSDEWRRWIYLTHGIVVEALQDERDKWEEALLVELIERALAGDREAMDKAIAFQCGENDEDEADYFPDGWNQAIMLHYSYTAQPWMWDLRELRIVKQPMGLAVLAGQVLVYDDDTWLSHLPLHVVGWATIVLSHGTAAREQVGDYAWARLMVLVARHQQTEPKM